MSLKRPFHRSLAVWAEFWCSAPLIFAPNGCIYHSTPELVLYKKNKKTPRVRVINLRLWLGQKNKRGVWAEWLPDIVKCLSLLHAGQSVTAVKGTASLFGGSWDTTHTTHVSCKLQTHHWISHEYLQLVKLRATASDGFSQTTLIHDDATNDSILYIGIYYVNYFIHKKSKGNKKSQTVQS